MNHKRPGLSMIGLALIVAVALTACGATGSGSAAAQPGEWEGEGNQGLKLTFTVAEKGDALTIYSFFYPVQCSKQAGMEMLLSETSVPLGGSQFELSSTNFSTTAKFVAPDRAEGTWHVNPHNSPQLGECREMNGTWVAQSKAAKTQATAMPSGVAMIPATATNAPSAVPTASVSGPKPGHWVGSSPRVSFDVTDQGKISNFEMSLLWGAKGCTVRNTDDLAVDAGGVFFIGKMDAAGKLDGNSIRGSFDSPTTVDGAYAATWSCENQIFSSSREGEWKASWQGESISRALPSSMPPPATATPVPIVGIEPPGLVDGVKLRFVSATLQDSYTLGPGDTNVPRKPGDTLLVVEAQILAGDSQKITGWKKEVFLTDETYTIMVPGISGTRTTNGQDPTALWVFAVPKTSRVFEMHFPGQVSVDLGPLLGIAAAQPTPQGGFAAATAPPTPREELAAATATLAVPTTASSLTLPPPLQPFACAVPRVQDFQSGSGFNEGKASWGSWGIKEGEYWLTLNGANSEVWLSDGLPESDSIFDVKATAGDSTGGAYGLLFAMDRLNNGQNFYAFVIDPKGSYALFRHTSQDWIELKKWTASPVLYTGNQPNQLRVVHTSPLISLFANGVHLTTVFDSTYSGSRYAGLIAWSAEGGGFSAGFDDYTVCRAPQSFPIPVNPMINSTMSWKSGQAIALSWTWLAKTQALAQSFTNQVETTVNVDGVNYTGLKEYWSGPWGMPGGYGAQWNLPLPPLDIGSHRIEFSVVAPQAVSDGYDDNGDGEPDMYGPGQVFTGWVQLDVKP